MTAAPTRPLAGRRIVVTRRPEQAGGLVARLNELGATVVELPLIEVAPPLQMAPLDDALRGLAAYHWVLFTSANAVRAVSERMTDLGLGERALTSRKIASVGPATTRALREFFPGVSVAVEAAKHDAEALLGELQAGAQGLRFLFPTSDRSRDVLPAGLREAGGEVDVVVAYRTVAPPGLRERIMDSLRNGADLVTFASPSAVENFVAAATEVIPQTRAAVIGPVTEHACRAAGIAVSVVAEPPSSEGLTRAIARHFFPERVPPG